MDGKREGEDLRERRGERRHGQEREGREREKGTHEIEGREKGNNRREEGMGTASRIIFLQVHILKNYYSSSC